MARLQASLLSAAECDTLHEQALTVLEEVGVAYNTPLALDILDERTLHVPGHRGFRADGVLRSSLRWR
jgi:trimethylamine:corrinoid methyltransferase-like protein